MGLRLAARHPADRPAGATNRRQSSSPSIRAFCSASVGHRQKPNRHDDRCQICVYGAARGGKMLRQPSFFDLDKRPRELSVKGDGFEQNPRAGLWSCPRLVRARLAGVADAGQHCRRCLIRYRLSLGEDRGVAGCSPLHPATPSQEAGKWADGSAGAGADRPFKTRLQHQRALRPAERHSRARVTERKQASRHRHGSATQMRGRNSVSNPRQHQIVLIRRSRGVSGGVRL
jgi:hypothetical protein